MKLFQRKEILLPSWKGWVLLVILLIGGGVLWISTIHRFLSPTSLVSDAPLLVVEGWAPDYVLEQVVTEFKKGTYKMVVATGLPPETGTTLIHYPSMAHVAEATLLNMGMNETQVVPVPAPRVHRDRTRECARALESWLKTSNPEIRRLNLVSLGTHSRRSWTSFRQVLGPEYQVGIMAVDSLGYEPGSWWKTSEGVRSVIGETLALLYAWLFMDKG